MIVYDKEQKEIVIPNGIGNIDIYNNGVEAGYNQGYEQGQADMAAKARVLEVTENGNYVSKFSDPIIPTVTGVYADGTEFYNCAELNGAVYNTKIKATGDSRLEFWFKGKNTTTENRRDVIIETNGIRRVTIEYLESNDKIIIYFGNVNVIVRGWTNAIWHHFIISKAEGICIDGKRLMNIPSDTTVNGFFFINGDGSYNNDKNSNGTFGMIKIDDTIIIPTADGFQNVNTGELIEVVKDGGYTFTENLPIYPEGELYKTINVNVPDLNGSYDEGYEQGKTDGINEQKSKLESINITENGTYTKEDGYNHIEVNVPDLNGSYEEGYNQGQTDAAANARVLDVTENGNYLSKYSDPIIPTVTGVYGDGTDFYNYAELTNQVYNTNIPATKDSRIEFWWKNDGSYVELGAIISAQGDNIFKFVEFSTNEYRIEYGYPYGGSFFQYTFTYNMTSRWNHIIFSKQDGLNVNGELICEIQGEGWRENATTSNFWINAPYLGEIDNNANGYFGMIKIDNTIIIPTADGFLNTNTGELIEVVKNGGYNFTENKIRYGEGELYKTINVDVIPKINIKKAGIKFGQSTFTEVPEWADFKGVTDFSYMFRYCSNLQIIPEIDTSNAINMDSMFNGCGNLTTVPAFDTSNVTNMGSMFYDCGNLTTVPAFDTSNVTNMYQMFFVFGGNKNLVSLPKFNCQKLNSMGRYFSYNSDGMSSLTDVGGWENLKCDWNDIYGLATCPNLTYQSCINILNGLYDFIGNGESTTKTLKVHPNFLTTVGNEISIGTLKGWSITA